MKGQGERHITPTATGERETREQLGDIVTGIRLFIHHMFIERLLCLGSVPGAGNKAGNKPGAILTHVELTFH